MQIRKRNLESEFVFATSRSSGPGGQHVNKTDSKVELRFNVSDSVLLSDKEKVIIIEKLSARINSNGELLLVSQKERSQYRNKSDVIEKFYILIEKALTPVKKRKATKPTKASKRRRLEAKKKLSDKKSNRNPPQL
ncbi:MAG: alternative ribosome rescue aminoacyl-tRNA hydrolase ArfB [Bacteroidota bacterium]|nr:alternative ribosome rescue aminoacyl-tRNA hydrolase ArfB [Bacteroidota bacterium]